MRFAGKVGYVIVDETPDDSGIYKEAEIVERFYKGDVVRQSIRNQAGQNINDDINISNQFSILADPFAWANFSRITYVEWMGAKWKVTTVEPQRPRILLTVGGVYNGEQANPA